MINFSDVVDIHKAVEYDSWGIPVPSIIERDVPCKVMYSLKQEELENVDGETVIVKANIYFEGLFQISYDDKISFTDDFGDSYTMSILDRKPIKDFSDEILYTRVSV